MKVVDIHPEELIDKLSAGELTPAERERLDAHLQQCSSCRFEIDVRADLELDAPPAEDRPQLTFPGISERTRPPGAQRVASVRPRSRRRWPLVLLAAALVLCAGGATAAVLTGALATPPWLNWAPERKEVSATAAATGAKAQQARRTVLEPAPAPADSVSEPTAPSSAQVGIEAPSPLAVPAIVSTPAPARVASPSSVPSVVANVRGPASAAFAPIAASADSPRAVAHADAVPVRADPAAALFADANRARRDGNADQAVALYRSLQSRYPASSESELSRALLAQLLLERGSPEAALAGFERYLAADAPVLGAEALVGRARALEQLGKSAQASSAWRDVQHQFPGSVHARLAATRLAALGTQ